MTYPSLTISLFRDDSKGEVKGLGNVSLTNDFTLSNVLLIDSLNFNLLSVLQLCDNGFRCSFTSDEFEVTSLDGKTNIFKGFRHESLYLVDVMEKKTSLTTCLFSKSSMDWL